MSDASMARQVTGRVVSNKMNQTIVVQVERQVRHERYGKYIRRSSKMLAHDAKNECQIGDTVVISECRPLSKRKTWQLVEVVERAK